ncbi:hypothetical protein D3C75_662530 [compost metagenome]
MNASALAAWYRRTHSVGRQLQHRCFLRKGGQPVRLMRFHPLNLERALLPDCIILVLNPQWRQLRAGIRRHEVRQQDVHRYAVRHNMMHVPQQPMAVLR